MLPVGGTRNSLGETFHDTWIVALDPTVHDRDLMFEPDVWTADVRCE